MKVDLNEVTVLYCEDEDQLREITSNFLSKVLKKVFVAKDGREGLELFLKHREEIDMVISDIAMPNMDGLEMAKEIKEIVPSIPVIIITAYSSSSYLHGALDLHVDKYLLKPLDLSDLIAVMEQSLVYHELKTLYRDPLTGLQTCTALNNDLASQPSQRGFALIKIDDFDKLSDLYGETMTRKIVSKIAESLRETFQENFTCYRAGNSTFALLSHTPLPSLTPLVRQLREFSARLRHEGIEVDGTTVRIDTVTALTDSISSRALEFGQHALKEAQTDHRDHCIFAGDHQERTLDAEENIRWIRLMDRALREKRFFPYFQPIVETQTLHTYKYEALLRFLDGEEAIITPDHFLEIAKKSNIYPMITRQILQEVLQILHTRPIRIAVNIAYADLIDQETLAFIQNLLSRYPKEARQLEFEILESEKIDNYDIARKFIETVRPYGCRVGIDDFGKGYSNFSILETLHVDYVKIDGSLIRHIDRSSRQAIVVEGIHSFCRRLGIDTVAEKVATEAEYTAVKEIGIPYAQGWYFSPALPPEELPHA